MSIAITFKRDFPSPFSGMHECKVSIYQVLNTLDIDLFDRLLFSLYRTGTGALLRGIAISGIMILGGTKLVLNARTSARNRPTFLSRFIILMSNLSNLLVIF